MQNKTFLKQEHRAFLRHQSDVIFIYLFMFLMCAVVALSEKSFLSAVNIRNVINASVSLCVASFGQLFIGRRNYLGGKCNLCVLNDRYTLWMGCSGRRKSCVRSCCGAVQRLTGGESKSASYHCDIGHVNNYIRHCPADYADTWRVYSLGICKIYEPWLLKADAFNLHSRYEYTHMAITESYFFRAAALCRRRK